MGVWDGGTERNSPRPTYRHASVDRVERRHAHHHQHHKRDAWFFAIEIATHFEFRPDWYRAGKVRDLVLEYYETQRSVLRSKSHLRIYLKRCRYCRIFFFTDLSNGQRTDLRCPFGCREAHRKREAARRSAAYYRSERGRGRKRILNRRRYLVSARDDVDPQETEIGSDADDVGESIIRYVRMVTSLIEGRRVSLEEIKEMLKKKERQHSLTRRRRVDYLVQQLNKDPP